MLRLCIQLNHRCIQISMMWMLVLHVVSSSNEAGQKTIKLEITHMKSQQSVCRETQSLLQQIRLYQALSKTKRKKSNLRQENRKRWHYSSSFVTSSSSSSSSTESENEMVDKRFKIILKGKVFKWNLPWSMADHANLHFKNYVSDKEIDEKILTENPVWSDLQDVAILNDFVKALLVLQTANWSANGKVSG